MTSQVIDAVFRGGVFRPLTPVDLTDNAHVRIVVSEERVVSDPPASQPKTLFGVLPQLHAVADFDIGVIKDFWRSSLDKQAHILHDGE